MGSELLTTKQVAELLDTPLKTVLAAAQRRNLHPAKFGRRLIFTRSEVVAWHKERTGMSEKMEREKAMVERFAKGAHPVDVYLDMDGRVTFKQMMTSLEDWARAAGIWIMEGPRGSYARWLQRLGLIELQPRHVRRVIELLLVDPYVAKLARLSLDQVRADESASTTAQLAATNETAPRRRYAGGPSNGKGRRS